MFLDAMGRHESLTAKHDIKIVGTWVDVPGHEVYILYDTPSMEKLTKLFMEPEMMGLMSFHTSRMIHLTPGKDAMELVKKLI